MLTAIIAIRLTNECSIEYRSVPAIRSALLSWRKANKSFVNQKQELFNHPMLFLSQFIINCEIPTEKHHAGSRIVTIKRTAVKYCNRLQWHNLIGSHSWIMYACVSEEGKQSFFNGSQSTWMTVLHHTAIHCPRFVFSRSILLGWNLEEPFGLKHESLQWLDLQGNRWSSCFSCWGYWFPNLMINL